MTKNSSYKNRLFRRASQALIASAGAVVAFGPVTAIAEVIVDVDMTTQSMHVASSRGEYTWAVSTARSGFSTPRGHFAPTGMERMRYSQKYHSAPMPYSILFRGGYAIHGAYATAALGTPASHGCDRLSPEHAQMLYEMVRREGASISINGSQRGASYASRLARAK